MINAVFPARNAQVIVSFAGGVPDARFPSVPRFAPGDSVVGAVQILPSAPVACNRLSVRGLWHTEGRGERDQIAIFDTNHPGTSLAAGVAQTLPFGFVLPKGPWSYAGNWFSIVWGIEVEIDWEWFHEDTFWAPFVLAPR